MIEKFGDYMYYLLSTPFKRARKEVNQWYLFFYVIGPLFDTAKLAFQTVRRESMVQTASKAMLPEHGLDRRLSRYEDETWENFRIRLMMYADTCRLGGTEVGTLQAVRALGFSEVEMLPAYKLDGNRERWAEFYVIISRDVDDTFDISHKIIRREVRTVKKVSGKDNYRFSYHIKDIFTENSIKLHRIIIRTEFCWYNNRVFNGMQSNNGLIYNNNMVMNHSPYVRVRNTVKHEESMFFRSTTWHHWRINDGATKNDGTKCFDAAIIEESI